MLRPRQLLETPLRRHVTKLHFEDVVQLLGRGLLSLQTAFQRGKREASVVAFQTLLRDRVQNVVHVKATALRLNPCVLQLLSCASEV